MKKSLTPFFALSFLTLLPFLAHATPGSGNSCDDPYRAARASAFGGEQWFTDIDELDRNFVQIHENPALPRHKRRFCAQEAAGRISSRLEPTFGEHNFRDTLSFVNPPGPVGGGMCWLHSRLQRQFSYLANYRPDLPRPTREQALEIIDRIVHRRGVTEIPGFASLASFSSAYEPELTSAIDGMGWACMFSAPLGLNTEDCFARVGDDFHPSAESVQATLDALRERMLARPGDIEFVRTRFEESNAPSLGDTVNRVFNPSAHSFLLVGMEPLAAPSEHPPLPGRKIGYRMQVIDPNHPHRVQEVDYHYGDTSLAIGSFTVVPYDHRGYHGDIPEMHQRIQDYCRP